MVVEQKTGQKMKCPRCGYEWEWHGTIKRVSCPNCGTQWYISRKGGDSHGKQTRKKKV